MQNYALLRLLSGNCNSLGLPEIKFHYPLTTDRERELHKKAIEKITVDHFQVSFYWSLVEEYQASVEKLKTISGSNPEPIIVPDNIMHGEIQFTINIRFNGYAVTDKENLAKNILDCGVQPRMDALDFTFAFMNREYEAMGRQVDQERLKREQLAAISKNLSFHEE